MAMIFEIRKEFQMLLNEIRKEKGIPLSKIEFVNEKGKNIQVLCFFGVQQQAWDVYGDSLAISWNIGDYFND
jgi:hypothetical protein